MNLILFIYLIGLRDKVNEGGGSTPACLEGAPHVYPSMKTGRMDGFKRMDSLFGELAAARIVYRSGWDVEERAGITLRESKSQQCGYLLIR